MSHPTDGPGRRTDRLPRGRCRTGRRPAGREPATPAPRLPRVGDAEPAGSRASKTRRPRGPHRHPARHHLRLPDAGASVSGQNRRVTPPSRRLQAASRRTGTDRRRRGRGLDRAGHGAQFLSPPMRHRATRGTAPRHETTCRKAKRFSMQRLRRGPMDNVMADDDRPSRERRLAGRQDIPALRRRAYPRELTVHRAKLDARRCSRETSSNRAQGLEVPALRSVS